jgi:catechol 2,3-dioxygenase-like lactoylglutathione lyase family enzyme
MKVSYVHLGVSDLDQSERFYRDMLDLPTQRRADRIEIRWPDFLLVLRENPPSARGKFHFGFRVESPAEVDAWAERLQSSGVRIIGGPASQNGRERQVFFLDPDQHELRIYTD